MFTANHSTKVRIHCSWTAEFWKGHSLNSIVYVYSFKLDYSENMSSYSVHFAVGVLVSLLVKVCLQPHYILQNTLSTALKPGALVQHDMPRTTTLIFILIKLWPFYRLQFKVISSTQCVLVWNLITFVLILQLEHFLPSYPSLL